MSRIVRAKTEADPDSERPVPRVNQLLFDVAGLFGISYVDARTRARYLRAKGLYPYARKTDAVTAFDAANLVMAFAGARTQEQSAEAVERYSKLEDVKDGRRFGERLAGWIGHLDIPTEEMARMRQIQFLWDMDCVLVQFGKFAVAGLSDGYYMFGSLRPRAVMLSATVDASALFNVGEFLHNLSA